MSVGSEPGKRTVPMKGLTKIDVVFVCVCVQSPLDWLMKVAQMSLPLPNNSDQCSVVLPHIKGFNEILFVFF